MSISNLIFTACVACKNQVRNRQKIKFKNQFREIEIFKNEVQIDKGLVSIKQDQNFYPRPTYVRLKHIVKTEQI